VAVVHVQKESIEQMRARTEDGLAIRWRLGTEDADGVVDLRAFTFIDDLTQRFRDAVALGRVINGPFWGLEGIRLELDYQEAGPMFRVEVNGYTPARGTGQTIEEACNRALASVERSEDAAHT
jgi:hypothetical protein